MSQPDGSSGPPPHSRGSGEQPGSATATAEGETPQLEFLLRLLSSRDFGHYRRSRLLCSFGSLEQLANAPEAELLRRGLQAAEAAAVREAAENPPVQSSPGVEETLHWLQAPENHLLSLWDPRYPALLREIPDPPLLLYAKGDAQVLSRPQFAVVGSRKASSAGKNQAAWIAAELARAGLCVCSGLAVGIDAAAHDGALSAEGTTVAVVGTGIDLLYPERNAGLAARIVAHGAMVSEFPLGTPPGADNFPRRNRIISGCSVGVLVVEAALKSGSLITARLAAEQNREVFAIPGSITHAGARGCHQLIKQGAKLVEGPEDILEELGSLLAAQTGPAKGSTPARPALPGLNEEERRLLEIINSGATHPDTLARECGMPAATISTLLLGLEAAGLVEMIGGRYLPR